MTQATYDTTTLAPKSISKWNETKLVDSEDVVLMTLKNNEGEGESSMERLIEKNLVHFYFCINGKAVLQFGPHYSRELLEGRNYFFFNPEKDLPVMLSLSPNCRMVLLTISLQHLHTLFMHEPLPFLKPENINRKFYDEKELSPALVLVMNQLFTVQLSEHSERLFYQGKVLEILSLYFSTKTPDTESCPFLKDEDKMRKIKAAREHLLKHLDEPPGIRELAKICGLNEYQLKVGFKEVYGNTIYGYLLDHKLDHSRILLDKGKLQVNEVAFEIGYKNPSHFIAAFRKKYGITPKKYLMNQRGKI